jgi:hypothetical protein
MPKNIDQPPSSAEIIKLPYSVTRGAYSRKPRRSKNGTPQERAAKAPPSAPAHLLPFDGQIPPILLQAQDRELLYLWKGIDPRDRAGALGCLRGLIKAREEIDLKKQPVLHDLAEK